MTISIPKAAEELSLDGLLVLTRTALGLGLGLLVADTIKRSARQATAIVLICLDAIPLVNRPGSDRSMRNRLRSIRAIPATGTKRTFTEPRSVVRSERVASAHP